MSTTLERRSDDELKRIAIDLHRGAIFTDRQIRHGADLPLVFMPLGMIGPERLTEIAGLVEPNGLLFEYLDKANPMGVNGMPTFFSCQVLPSDEADVVLGYVTKLREAEQAL